METQAERTAALSSARKRVSSYETIQNLLASAVQIFATDQELQHLADRALSMAGHQVWFECSDSAWPLEMYRALLTVQLRREAR